MCGEGWRLFRTMVEAHRRYDQLVAPYGVATLLPLDEIERLATLGDAEAQARADWLGHLNACGQCRRG